MDKTEQTMEIYFTSVEDVKRFVQTTAKSSGDFDVREGHYVLDGKSLMGLLLLPFHKPLNLVAKNAEPECIAKIQELFSKGV